MAFIHIFNLATKNCVIGCHNHGNQRLGYRKKNANHVVSLQHNFAIF